MLFFGGNMKKKYRLIGVPLKYGCNIEGADLGIERLQEKNHFDTVLAIPDFEEPFIPSERHVQKITKVCTTLAKEIDDTLSHHQTPIVIGGDHALAIGSIAGDAKNHEIGVLWVDSHADINTNETTPTGNIHGFPLAISIGYGIPQLVNCYQSTVKVKEENIVLFGCTDIDEPEQKFINDHQIKLFSYTEIQKRGLEACLAEAIQYLQNKVSHVHLSLDIDSMDSLVAPGVNINYGISIDTRDGLGFQKEDIHTILKQVLTLPISAVDVVEYNPLHDHEDTTLKITNDIIELLTTHFDENK